MDQFDLNLLFTFAKKYIWWKTPEEAIQNPERVIAQVMNIGDYDDVQYLVEKVDEATLKNVLMNSEIGQFNERSWHYWCYRLDLASLDNMPPMPKRKLG